MPRVHLLMQVAAALLHTLHVWRCKAVAPRAGSRVLNRTTLPRGSQARAPLAHFPALPLTQRCSAPPSLDAQPLHRRQRPPAALRPRLPFPFRASERRPPPRQLPALPRPRVRASAPCLPACLQSSRAAVPPCAQSGSRTCKAVCTNWVYVYSWCRHVLDSLLCMNCCGCFATGDESSCYVLCVCMHIPTWVDRGVQG